jgi:Fic family protein
MASLLNYLSLPEPGARYAGYAALIERYSLQVPVPDHLCVIGARHKMYDRDLWRVFTPRHEPDNTIFGHLVFALRYEGIELLVLKALFKTIVPAEITQIVKNEPTGSYSRRIWFLYEWLLDAQVDLPNVEKGNFVSLVNEKLQYAGVSERSKRHRVNNNLPGCRGYCPMIRRTEKLEGYIQKDLSKKAEENIGKTRADLLKRASAFLELKDSRASFEIEGERPPQQRLARWARIIGEAGKSPLTLVELERLQAIVIQDNRFTMPGLRLEGGFVGEHDRVTQMPMPEHISAKHDDLPDLMEGLIETNRLLKETDFDPVLMACLASFGFVFIHPFEDGNGRIHRYIIHHVLAETKFVPGRIVFPISSVFQDRIEVYRQTLEAFSKPRLNFIEWQPTAQGNVHVTNETIDLYRYYDATRQAEFLYECVDTTVNETLPNEVNYLEKHEKLCRFISSLIDMPNRQVNLLVAFLEQEQGRLSKRARNKEFAKLTEKECEAIESKYTEIFSSG